LRAIKGTGYTGYIAHEFVPKADATTALLRSFKQCASILE
jgi:hydroxypyruvate isomerase